MFISHREAFLGKKPLQKYQPSASWDYAARDGKWVDWFTQIVKITNPESGDGGQFWPKQTKGWLDTKTKYDGSGISITTNGGYWPADASKRGWTFLFNAELKIFVAINEAYVKNPEHVLEVLNANKLENREDITKLDIR